MTVVQTDKTRMHALPPGLEVPPDRSFYMSLGFWRACPPMPWVGPASFGHPGSGGSVGFADPDAGVGFAYIPNLWSWNIAEPRAKNLAAAVAACLEWRIPRCLHFRWRSSAQNEKAPHWQGFLMVGRAGIEPATSGLQSGAVRLAAPLVSWLG
jgi:hypothetical protein